MSAQGRPPITTPWYASAALKGVTWLGEPSGAGDVAERRAAAAATTQAAGSQVMGRGYDTFTSELRGYALKEADVIDEIPRGGQLRTYTMRSITSARELRDSMGLDASVAFSFSRAKGSVKAEWAHARDVSAYSVYLLVRVTVANVRRTLRRFELSDEARALVAERPFDPKAFHRKYGDHFVSEHLTGGELFALYEFRTSSFEERSRLKAEVAAAGGTWDASADFELAMRNLHAEAESTLYVHLNGGKGRLPEVSPETLLELARAFPEAVDEAPVLYDTGTTDYYVAEGFPGDVDLPYRPNKQVFVGLAAVRDQERMLEGAVDYARRNPGQLKGGEGWDPEASLTQLRRLADRTEDEARAVAERPFVEHASRLDALRREVDDVEQGLPREVADVMTRASGVFAGHSSQKGWTLHQGSGARRFPIQVRFERPFYKVPEVRLALTGFDILHGTNHRLKVGPENVTREGFEAVIQTWGDTRVWAAHGNWVATI